jgi:hypothetical protein
VIVFQESSMGLKWICWKMWLRLIIYAKYFLSYNNVRNKNKIKDIFKKKIGLYTFLGALILYINS